MYDFAYICETKADLDLVFSAHEPYTPMFNSDGIWDSYNEFCKEEPFVLYLENDLIVGWDSLRYCEREHPRLTLVPASYLCPKSWNAELEEILL